MLIANSTTTNYWGNTYTNSAMLYTGLAIMLIVPISTWVTMAMMYGLGELIENSNEQKKYLKILADVNNNPKAALNAQELPRVTENAARSKILCVNCGKEISSYPCSSCGHTLDTANKLPVRVLPDEDGRILCPSCNTKQNGDRNVCYRCGQVFVNGQPGIPYWCGKCGKPGPFTNDVCPDCASTMKIMNHKQ